MILVLWPPLSVKKQSERMLTEKVLSEHKLMTQEVVLVGCEGKITKPKCMYEVELKIYGESCIVPVLVMPGQ